MADVVDVDMRSVCKDIGWRRRPQDANNAGSAHKADSRRTDLRGHNYIYIYTYLFIYFCMYIKIYATPSDVFMPPVCVCRISYAKALPTFGHNHQYMCLYLSPPQVSFGCYPFPTVSLSEQTSNYVEYFMFFASCSCTRNYKSS